MINLKSFKEWGEALVHGNELMKGQSVAVFFGGKEVYRHPITVNQKVARISCCSWVDDDGTKVFGVLFKDR